ncbi:MAG TPA: hypothetical protein VIL86_09410 [Tepidisphaeraceae bacterium]|jgi:hypothetical protein
MIANNDIESSGEKITRPAERSHHRKRQRRRVQPSRQKILMRDGVPPAIQFLKQVLAALVMGGRDRLDAVPKVEVEPIEVRADRAGGRISYVKLPVCRQDHAKNIPARIGVEVLPAQPLDGFGMKIPAEALEVAGNQDEVGVVDLQHGITSPARVAAYGRVSILDLIQCGSTVGTPIVKRSRGHGNLQLWLDAIVAHQRGFRWLFRKIAPSSPRETAKRCELAPHPTSDCPGTQLPR